MNILEFEKQIAYMPLLQQQIVLRDASEQLRMLRAVVARELAELKEIGLAPGHTRMRAAGAAIADIEADASVIGSLLKRVNDKLASARWQDAITALYGQEAYEACREWVIARHAEHEQQLVPVELLPNMIRYGLTQ